MTAQVDARRFALEWLVPLGVAIVLLGPALKPGMLLNLDLILVPRLDTPTGFWGLGPELPRRLPLWVPISWVSALVPATAVGKALMVALFVAPWVGMARLTKRLASSPSIAGPLVCATAGAIYALSPFVLTRAAVGHFNVTFPHAVLPWVLPILLRPGRRLSSTFLACFALGFAGHFGGSVALTIVFIAIVCGQHERWIAALLVALAAQSAWLVPGVLVAVTTDVQMASGTAFPTAADTVAGLARLSAGGGFWNAYFQIGGSGLIVALCGIALLAFAVLGTRMLSVEFRTPLVVIGIVGWLIAAATAINGLDSIFVWVNDNLLGGIWREGHRMLSVHLLWIAPSAALGARRAYDELRHSRAASMALVAPLAIAVLLAIPGVWGLQGHVGAEPVPDGWEATREQVRAEPGTVLALPWYQYFNLSIEDGRVRRVLNPLPLYLGGDVLSSSDNGLQVGVRELGDPREARATDLVKRLVGGDSISSDLADLGVRWVVVLDTVQAKDYAQLQHDDGLAPVVADDDIALYEVLDWVGPARTADGAPVELDRFGPALASVDTSERVVLGWPGSTAWRRGTAAASITDDGLVDLPSGSGPIWNVATVPALVGQIVPVTVVAVIVVGRLAKRRRPAA